MLRTRLASLALAAGLSLTSGCLNFSRPWGSGPGGCCCPPAGGCCDGVTAGFGGVVGTPCCSSHAAPPGAVEGPVLVPPHGVPPAGPDNGVLAPAPSPRLVPAPHAVATPYAP
jgi:hypothetical protein